MVKIPDISPNAPWKQRFRAAKIHWARIATLNPQRGLVCSDRDGIVQLYAWDVDFRGVEAADGSPGRCRQRDHLCGWGMDILPSG